jgi:Zn-dependent protease with chaperone function
MDLVPLLKALRALGAGSLTVQVVHPSLGFSQCTPAGHARAEGDRLIAYKYDFDVDEEPLPLGLTFGYPDRHLWRLLPLPALVLLPIALSLAVRRGLLRAPEADRYVVLARFLGFQYRLALVTGCLWVGTLATLDLGKLVSFALVEWLPNRYLVFVLLFVVPPVLVIAAGPVVAGPVWARVPEVGRRAAQVVRQAVWGSAAMLAVLVGGAVATYAAAGGDRGRALLAMVTGVGLSLLCAYYWRAARGSSPEPLPPGELRDRLFELADKAVVHVGQAYLLPPPRWRVLHLFTGPGNSVHLTEAVLAPLSKREVDSLLAHELVYLWRRHVRALWWPLLVIVPMIVLAAVLVGLTYRVGLDFERWSVLVILPAIVATRLTSAGLRRFGARQDAEAVALTGDAEALITALAKLSRLGLLPVCSSFWSRPFLTEPFPWMRIEALAARAGILPERLDEILAGPGTGKEHYALPADAAGRRADGAPGGGEPRLLPREASTNQCLPSGALDGSHEQTPSSERQDP